MSSAPVHPSEFGEESSSPAVLVPKPALFPGKLARLLPQQPPPKPGLVRIGWLQKYSKRGYQPRLALLLADRFVYASRVASSPTLFLKVETVEIYPKLP
ncbi:unnamed protein product [Protopolystoma xenopodis]|uniref:Uncharacterized protein n=1 Tax=Protopolystoma xenopodis TaxID=117903 RepID=A0A3S5A3K9_9PLAT|nr:unnamed protein product [Protopolystoma xenopodis]